MAPQLRSGIRIKSSIWRNWKQTNIRLITEGDDEDNGSDAGCDDDQSVGSEGADVDDLLEDYWASPDDDGGHGDDDGDTDVGCDKGLAKFQRWGLKDDVARASKFLAGKLDHVNPDQLDHEIGKITSCPGEEDVTDLTHLILGAELQEHIHNEDLGTPETNADDAGCLFSLQPNLNPNTTV